MANPSSSSGYGSVPTSDNNIDKLHSENNNIRASNNRNYSRIFLSIILIAIVSAMYIAIGTKKDWVKNISFSSPFLKESIDNTNGVGIISVPTSSVVSSPTSSVLSSPTSSVVSSPTSSVVSSPTSSVVSTPVSTPTTSVISTPTEVSVSIPTSPVSVSTPTTTVDDLAPTRYPTAATPTLYPTAAHPTEYPTPSVNIVVDTNPTQYPTDPAPTKYPTSTTTDSTTTDSTTTDSNTDSTTTDSTTDSTTTDSTTTDSNTDSTTTDSTTDSTTTDSTTTDTTIEDEDSDQLDFTTYKDGYPILSTYFGREKSSFMLYKTLEDYVGVVEPNSDMYLYVYAAEEENTEYYYEYSVCSDSTGECETLEYSAPFNYDCTPITDTYTVEVNQYQTSDSQATGIVGKGSLKCFYVRREIRSLSAEDLTKTVDAMWEMWRLEEDEGQAAYGEDFHNYAYLLEFHYFNAAWQDADHIHEGNGFLAQHMKMDLIFEQSLQAIDNSVSLPYWDFTIENATGLAIWDSPIFTAETFGSLPLPKDTTVGWVYTNDDIEGGGIQDGYWQNFRADVNYKYEELKSAYGYMRAPWNMNPANVITRFTSIDKWLPTCDAHYTLLSYTLLSDFLFQVPYDAHASAHGVIGGVYGCDLFDPLLEMGYIIDEQAKLNLCKNWIFYLKEFYRDNLILPKSNCTSTDPVTGEFSSEYENQNCGFDCVPEYMNILLLQLKRSVLNSDYDCVPDEDTMPPEGWVAWKDFICTGDGYKIFGGDHLESASPADPSFWPIHPTLERLFQARLMAGGLDTEEWPSDPVNDYVCNKVTCYDTAYAETDDIRAPFGSWDNCCYGHYGDDQLLDAPNGNRFAGTGLTNKQALFETNPTKSEYAREYIYDNFDWDHCLDVGLDFDELLYTMKYTVNSTQYNESAVIVTSDKGWRQVRI